MLLGVPAKSYEQDCACSVETTHESRKILFVASTSHSESDCACESGGPAVNSLPLFSTSWRRSEGLFEIPLDDDHKYIISPIQGGRGLVINEYVDDVLHIYNEPITFDEVKTRLADTPFNSIVQVSETLAELRIIQPSSGYISSQSESLPHTISAWLHLTDRCNLRCSYCYLPHVREDMSAETGPAAIDAIFRSAVANNFKQVKIKYAGGEPLLRYPLILELHQYAKALADSHNLILEEVVLSNGTLLTKEMVDSLKALNINLMISMDGLGHYHDRHRPYAGGRGSFSDVVEAVDVALESGLTPNISVTVSSRTAEGLPEIMGWILERELPFSLNFYRENELSASHEDMKLDEEKIIKGMLAAFKVIEGNLPRRSFLGGIIDRANLSASHTHTCGVGQNYLVFDQNGQVAKCQMHIRKPITDLHVADPLAVIRADRTGIQNLSVEEKEGCKTCEWKHWCTGGCPLATHRATGRYDVKSPNCNIYKALYPEALRLEGLRLLKYQDDPDVVIAI